MSDSIQAEIVDEPHERRQLTRSEVVEEQTKAIREDLYQKSIVNQLAILEWARVTPDQEEPPEDWVSRFGAERAREMLVVAQAAHLPTRACPVGLKMTQETFVGLERAKATDRLARSPNSVTIVVGEAPPPPLSMPAPKGDDR